MRVANRNGNLKEEKIDRLQKLEEEEKTKRRKKILDIGITRIIPLLISSSHAYAACVVCRKIKLIFKTIAK